LWNSNSLLGILWGFLFFNELRQAGWRRWTGVLGGALVMCAGAALLAVASSTAAPAAHSLRGVWAALGAGILWGTMYIPYRKAYLTGMNPLSFITFFTFGELGMMATLAVSYLGLAPLWRELTSARDVLFWLMLGGFVWVIGDVFQQYAAKYVGISRGIPLSNSNQLWGLLWGILVFGELHGRSSSVYLEVIGGSLLMMLGVGAIAFSSAIGKEQMRWKDAAQRESHFAGQFNGLGIPRQQQSHGQQSLHRGLRTLQWHHPRGVLGAPERRSRGQHVEQSPLGRIEPRMREPRILQCHTDSRLVRQPDRGQNHRQPGEAQRAVPQPGRLPAGQLAS